MIVGEGWGVAELAQEQRDLPAVIDGVIECVLDELAERVGSGVECARRVELGPCEAA